MAVSTSPSSPGDTEAHPSVTTTDTPEPRGSRIAHVRPLDGLRGIAVLAVVVYHFAPDVAPGGFLGVDLFFVLSGFLITSLLVAERESTGRTALRDFWVRRARRLFPALFLVLVAVALWSILKATPIEQDRLRDDGLATIGYFANWRFIYSGQSYIEQFIGVRPSPLRHTWSLAIEEQFYLVWPLVVAGIGVLVARRARAGHTTTSLRRALIVVCLVAAAISIVLMALLFSPGDDPSRVYYGTDTRAHLLLIGAALGAATAGVLAIGQQAARRAVVVAGSLALVGLILAFLTVDPIDTWLYEAGYGGIAVGVALIIAAAGQPGTNPLARLLSTRPLVGLGLISYGVYLWHWPITVWFDEEQTGLDGVALFLLRSALTLAVSIASYLLVEMPIRRGALRRVNPKLPRLLSPLAVIMAIFVLLLPSMGVARFTEEPAVPVLASVGTEEVTARYEQVPRCDTPSPGQPSPALAGRWVALFGNSIAGEVAPCLDVILRQQGMRFDAYTQSAVAVCDFFNLFEERILPNPPEVAVIYAQPVSYTPCTEDLEGEALERLWARDVRRAVEMLRGAGTIVYLVPPVVKAGEAGEHPLGGAYREIAADDPAGVKVLDAGSYLRDANAVAQWQMPCTSDGEAGCEDGVVGVRLILDGTHMCTDPEWRSGPCDDEFAAGERRAASSIAAQLLLDLAQQPRRPGV